MELANDKFDPERYGLITGSKCSVLFPQKSAEVGQKTYARQLATQMYFRYYDETGTWQTEHGNLAESSAREFYQDNFDKNVHEPGFIRDGYWGGTGDCLGEDYGIDFKCPTTLQGWLDYIHVGINDQQFNQAQMYMKLYKRELWKVCVFLLETDRMSNVGLTYPVDYKKRMIVIDVPKDPTWDVRLQIATPQVIRWRDEYYRVLKNNFD